MRVVLVICAVVAMYKLYICLDDLEHNPDSIRDDVFEPNQTFFTEYIV